MNVHHVLSSIAATDAGQALHWLLAAVCLILYGTVRRLGRTVVLLKDRVEVIAATVEFPEGPEGDSDAGRIVVGDVPIGPSPVGEAAAVHSDELLNRWREQHSSFGRLHRGGIGQ